jgi:hypothetical protein
MAVPAETTLRPTERDFESSRHHDCGKLLLGRVVYTARSAAEAASEAETT